MVKQLKQRALLGRSTGAGAAMRDAREGLPCPPCSSAVRICVGKGLGEVFGIGVGVVDSVCRSPSFVSHPRVVSRPSM